MPTRKYPSETELLKQLEHQCECVYKAYKGNLADAAISLHQFAHNNREIIIHNNLVRLFDFERIKSDAKSVENYIKDNQWGICKEAIQLMADYLEKYEVEAKKVDVYKVAYCFGYILISGLYKTNKIHCYLAKLSMAYVMDETLFTDVEMYLEENMRTKIITTMLENSATNEAIDHWEEVFGKFGIYMVYKNVFKMCRVVCDYHPKGKLSP